MKLIVCDASAIVEYLLQTEVGSNVGRLIESQDCDIHVPALCDIEVVSTLRRILVVSNSGLTEIRAKQAIADLLELPLTRHTHENLIEKVFALRNNFSAYDAVYVALAEVLGAKLLTADQALANGPLPQSIEVILF